MEFNRLGYAINFLERKYKASYQLDFTLSDTLEVVAWNNNKGASPSLVEITSGVLALVKQDLVSRINNLSGEIRNSYLSDGMFVLEEYRMAEAEAKDYAARSFTDPVPQTLSDYADILKTTNYQMVAQNIIAAGTQMKTMLVILRKLRLGTNASVMAAVSVEDAAAIYVAAAAVINTVRKP